MALCKNLFLKVLEWSGDEFHYHEDAETKWPVAKGATLWDVGMQFPPTEVNQHGEKRTRLGAYAMTRIT